ncbi:MAG TPA: hypothetical protein PLH94_00280 [Fimbriimonadaceae bacterium]|nr:hypothetical protein [Fimbriimonadaceae bacterium]
MTINRKQRNIFAVALTALALLPMAHTARAQLAPPQLLGGPPIIIGSDQGVYDVDIAASKPRSLLSAEDREVPGGGSIVMRVILVAKKTKRPLAGQRIYASVSNRPNRETGFKKDQFLGEAVTNSRGEAYFTIHTRRVTRLRNVRIKFEFYETSAYKGDRDYCTLFVRP